MPSVPITNAFATSRFAPDRWRPFMDLLDETAKAGGRMFAQVHSRPLNTLLSFQTQLPFDRWDVWRDIRALPLAEQQGALRDPDTRARLVEVANGPAPGGKIVGVEARPPDYDHLYIMDDMRGEDRLLRDVATQRGMDPVELMRHPRSVVTFSDSGAHVSQIMDSSLQTHVLSHWVREQEALTLEEAVRQLSFNNASHWGMFDRGLVREGMNADLLVFDPNTVAPAMPEVVNDLPGGAKRLKQVATGIKNTIVNGEVFLEDNEHTGATAGQLFRGTA